MSMHNESELQSDKPNAERQSALRPAPRLSTEILTLAGVEQGDAERFRENYEMLFFKWEKRTNIRDFTEIGRIFYSALLKCEFSALQVALLADHRDAFTNQLESQQQETPSNLAEWLEPACIFGAQKTATWLFEQLDYNLKELPLEQKTELLALIATSPNRDWLNEFWNQLELDTVPEEANRYLHSFSLRRIEKMLTDYSPPSTTSPSR
jgi:hypothetical protein